VAFVGHQLYIATKVPRDNKATQCEVAWDALIRLKKDYDTVSLEYHPLDGSASSHTFLLVTAQIAGFRLGGSRLGASVRAGKHPYQRFRVCWAAAAR